MATAWEILEECLLRGYFDLKARFLRHGVEVPPRVGDLPYHPFNETFLRYSAACKDEIRRRPHTMPTRRHLARLGRWALRAEVGAKRRKTPPGKGRDDLASDPLLIGAYLTINRSLCVLGFIGPGYKGFQVYAECCLQFHERHVRLRDPPDPRDVIQAAIRVVAEKTGCDPCNLDNWATPENVDWEQVIAINQRLWTLLGPESDPYNYCNQG